MTELTEKLITKLIDWTELSDRGPSRQVFGLDGDVDGCSRLSDGRKLMEKLAADGTFTELSSVALVGKLLINWNWDVLMVCGPNSMIGRMLFYFCSASAVLFWWNDCRFDWSLTVLSMRDIDFNTTAAFNIYDIACIAHFLSLVFVCHVAQSTTYPDDCIVVFFPCRLCPNVSFIEYFGASYSAVFWSIQLRYHR